MVYDCFAFFNELDLLDLRLNELDSVVDKFVLVEATRTFQKKDKPLYFEENKHLFKKFGHKIIHIIVDEYPHFFTKFRVPTAWDYDRHQKKQIGRGLTGCKPEDVIIVSDIDEIPFPDKILACKDKAGIKVFQQYQSYYFLNNVCRRIHDYGGKAIAQVNKNNFGFWNGSVMLFFKDFENAVITRRHRDEQGTHITVIEQAGWHFSYMGGIDKIIQKLGSWSHPEYNTPENKNPERIEYIIRNGKSLFCEDEQYELVSLAHSSLPFPKYLIENVEKYQHLLLSPDVA